MIRTQSLAEFNKEMQTVVTIGTFDGVHLGHQKIIDQLVRQAKKLGLPSVVLTFFPHPRMVLQQDSQIRMLQSIDERAGRNRNANIEDLKRYGVSFNFEVTEISAREIDALAVSSTKIRKALQKGDVQKAATFLGAGYTLSGKVVSGKKIGRDLGFPTANIAVDFVHKLIPKEGVYVVRTEWQGQEVFGMLNIGQNPTVNREENKTTTAQQKIEVHLFDFSEDLYNQKLVITFLTHLRAEQKFDSLDQLKEQLKADQKKARSFLSTL